MSWTESEKLNEWIQRAYENGRREEQERIIKLLKELIPSKPTYEMSMEYWVQRKLVEQAIARIKGENK